MLDLVIMVATIYFIHEIIRILCDWIGIIFIPKPKVAKRSAAELERVRRRHEDLMIRHEAER